MNTTQQKPDWLRVLASYLVPLLIGVAAVAVANEKLAQAEEDIQNIQVEQKTMVTQQVLDLTIAPIQQQVEYNGETLQEQKESIKRIEDNVYEILRAVK